MLTYKIYIILSIFLPFFSALTSYFFSQKICKKFILFFNCVAPILSFILILYLFFNVIFLEKNSLYLKIFEWLTLSFINIDCILMIDYLSISMLLLVSFISTMVQIYTIKYMNEESLYYKFSAYISSFTSAMMILVSSGNFFTLFVGWEGVGLFSYLLIGFYFSKNKSIYAATKAFLINKTTDIFLLLGFSAILYYYNTINYEDLLYYINNNTININNINLICIFIFLGAMGKSAQIPFHAWLEGSMEGPTPASALIHSATMVTAGVFLINRLSFLFVNSSILYLIMIIGAVTALMMSIVALYQNDIKLIIAYCTISQLGYMIAAQGAGAFSFGIFHLISHAIFKTLMFLSAGCVIIKMKNERNINKMGGLYKTMPITYLCMLISILSVTAIPPFSGFFSKDLILTSILLSDIACNKFVYLCLNICIFFTNLYSFKMLILIFHGKMYSIKNRLNDKESFFMLIPMIILSIISIIFGYLVFKFSIYINFINSNILEYYFINKTETLFLQHIIFNLSSIISIFSIIIMIGFFFNKNHSIFIKTFNILEKSKINTIIRNKYFIDFLYDNIINKIYYRLSKKLFMFIEINIFSKFLEKGIINLLYNISLLTNKIQNGYFINTCFISILIILLLSYLLF